MRGKEYQSSFVARRLRITPAYAGKSTSATNRNSTSTDHPRLCGEKKNRPHHSLVWKGSPPPMRGKVTHCMKPMLRLADHPRLCGEKVVPSVIHSSSTGSPPPMRGKEQKEIIMSYIIRITPAYAGKSFTISSARTAARDHPRLCGEKGLPETAGTAALGSPPPMRGKVAFM